jgi:DNA polymerase III subunit alpha
VVVWASHLSVSIIKDQTNLRENENDVLLKNPYAHECSDCTTNIPCSKHQGESIIDVVKWYKSVFKDRYYLEIMNHGIKEEDIIRDTIMELGKKLDIKIVATGDTHIVRKEDIVSHNIMIALYNRKSIYDEDFKPYRGDGYYLPDKEYLNARFSNFPEAIINTLEVAERCNFEFQLGNFKIPTFIDVRNEDETFKKEVFDGLLRRFPNGIPKQYVERAYVEIDTIIKMTYPNYFLMTADYVNYAKSKGILVGAGRGSAGGCLVAYALGITEVDPLVYNLSFSRFLNAGRSAIPEISFKELSFEEFQAIKLKQ